MACLFCKIKEMKQADFDIQRLGPCTVRSPMKGINFTGDEEHVVYHRDLDTIKSYLGRGAEPPRFEAAGPREKIFFDPGSLACGIVTCGGLCPGINDVIRAIVLSLHFHYEVKDIYGFRYGYQGLVPAYGHEPLRLTPGDVTQINEMGGTILASSRGNQDPVVMVDTLAEMKIGILLPIGIGLLAAKALAQRGHMVHLPSVRRQQRGDCSSV